MINELPTVFEVVTGAVKQAKDQAATQNNSSKNKSSGRMVSTGLHDSLFRSKHLLSRMLQLCIFICCCFIFYFFWGCFSQPSRQPESQPKAVKTSAPNDEDVSGEEEEDDDEQGATLCGACGDNYANDEFWICCDICERWFHGKCVKITPAKAEHIKQYKCPSCSSKRARV